MIIYDTIYAHEIEDEDQVYVNGDPLEHVTRQDVGDLVVVTGYSHNTGDREVYNLLPDHVVELWMV